MTNVITSGCSFTYNTEMTWVKKLDEKYIVRNVASCAAGQDYISRQAIRMCEMLKDYPRVLICQWSGIHRRAFFTENNFGFKEGSPYMDKTQTGYWIKNGGNGLNSKVSKNELAEKHLFEPYRKMYNETQGAIESLDHISRTQWYCKLNKIPMLNFWWKDELSKIDTGAGIENWTPYKLVDWSTFWFHKKYGGMSEWIVDNMWDPGFAEGNHPTQEQHNKFAEEIILPWLEENI